MRNITLSKIKPGRIVLIIILLLFCVQAYSQKGNSFAVKRADAYYEQFDFRTAIDLYVAADKKLEDNLYVKGRIGNCYKFINEIQKAEEWYGPVAQSDETDPIYKFYYAQSLMANGKYLEAMNSLNSYYKIMGKEDAILTALPEGLFDEDLRYEIKIEEFNSKFADFSPYIIRDELFFVSNRKDDAILMRNDVWSERPFTQLYKIPKEKKDVTNKDVTEEKNVKKDLEVFNSSSVSKRYHEGPLTLDPIQNDIYFTRSNYSKNKAVKGADNEVNLKILKVAFVSNENGGGEFGDMMVDNCTFSSDEFSIAYPTITIDGNYMVFASDMPGGMGGLDLYVTENVGGMWANPINLGSLVNTPGNDAFPHIMRDGTLYFASDGHFGLGGYDLYEAKLKEDGSFDVPVNLRSPINSTFDDFGLWMDDNYSNGYFTSNRPSAYGDDDIYSFTRETFILEAIIYDSKTEDLLPNTEVSLINIETGREVILTTDDKGYITTDILPNTKYGLKVTKDEYLPESAEFVTAEDNVYAEIPLVKDYGIVLDVTVIDQDTKDEIPFATVSLINLKTAKEYTVTTNKYGKTSFVIDGESEYRLRASKDLPGIDSVYLAVTKEFNTYGTKAPAQLFTVIELKKQPLGVDIIIEDILYDLDKYFIRKDAALILDNLIKVLLDNPTIEIELAAHTDCRADQKYNMWLSAKRAEAAVNYLIEKGIDYRRLTAAGYGESQPLEVPGSPGLYCTCEGPNGPGKTDPRCTEEVHQLNRRTVFTILKK